MKSYSGHSWQSISGTRAKQKEMLAMCWEWSGNGNPPARSLTEVCLGFRCANSALPSPSHWLLGMQITPELEQPSLTSHNSLCRQLACTRALKSNPKLRISIKFSTWSQFVLEERGFVLFCFGFWLSFKLVMLSYISNLFSNQPLLFSNSSPLDLTLLSTPCLWLLSLCLGEMEEDTAPSVAHEKLTTYPVYV